MLPVAIVIAVAWPSGTNAHVFAAWHSIHKLFSNYGKMLGDLQRGIVSITAPNWLHAEMTIAAAGAGKRVAFCGFGLLDIAPGRAKLLVYASGSFILLHVFVGSVTVVLGEM
jgi:hypothetical protein